SSELRIHHSCLWQQQSPYEACSASHMALAPSVHIATHFGQGISCSRKKLSMTLKVSELFCTSMQLLTEYKFLLHLILVDNHTNAKNRGSFDMSVDSSNCSAK